MKNTYSIIAGLTLGALALSSCTAVNPYTGQTETSKTTKGAVFGAAGGAALGALIGNNRSGGSSRKYAIRGAVAGGLAGAGIGNYMDQQEAQIRQQLQGSGVSVTRSGNDLILNMPSDITFSTGKSSIQPRFVSTLGSVALVLNKYNKTRIGITGHTDSDGSNAYNQNLSVARAQSVGYVLNSRGVTTNRILTGGRGETSPIASNASASGKAQNRRVELRIVPQQNQF